jgi:hypothetical protein
VFESCRALRGMHTGTSEIRRGKRYEFLGTLKGGNQTGGREGRKRVQDYGDSSKSGSHGLYPVELPVMPAGLHLRGIDDSIDIHRVRTN